MTLNELKRHPYYPFSDFETNDLSFLLLELYWAELFRDIVTASGTKPDAGGWVPWFPAYRPDGNPILMMINRACSPARELRIIQRFNTEGPPALDLEHPRTVPHPEAAYTSFVPDLSYGKMDEDAVTPIEELLISSDISPAW